MLDDLKDLIDDFDHIISLDISEVQKKERFLEAEIKLGILLSNISKAIYDYAGDTLNFIEDKTLTNLVIGYMEALKREDIHHVDIHKYYNYHMIPFYKGYQKVVLEAINQNNKSLLLQAGEWTITLNFRSILMIKILKTKKYHF
jgi:hypothetical protein